MKQHKNVQSTATSIPLLEVNIDTVYVRTNVHCVKAEDFICWEYDEIQYSYREYLELLAKQEEVKAIESRLLTPLEVYRQLDKVNASLEELKLHKKKQLDYLCTQTILGRFEVELNGNTYEFSNDTEAQLRFTGIGVLFMDNKITEIEWTTYLNGERMRITLDKTDFDKVSHGALMHQNTNIIKYNDMLKAVDTCETNEEVDSINW